MPLPGSRFVFRDDNTTSSHAVLVLAVAMKVGGAIAIAPSILALSVFRVLQD